MKTHKVYIMGEFRIYGSKRKRKHLRPYVKIGVARNVQRRIAALQTGNPRELRALIEVGPFTRKQAYAIEKEMHRRFRTLRINGEWFRTASALDTMTLTLAMVDDDQPEGNHLPPGRAVKERLQKMREQRAARKAERVAAYEIQQRI